MNILKAPELKLEIPADANDPVLTSWKSDAPLFDWELLENGERIRGGMTHSKELILDYLEAGDYTVRVRALDGENYGDWAKDEFFIVQVTPENLEEHLGALGRYWKRPSDETSKVRDYLSALKDDFERFKCSSNLPAHILFGITNKLGLPKSQDDLKIEALEYGYQSLRESHIKLQDAVSFIQERIVRENKPAFKRIR